MALALENGSSPVVAEGRAHVRLKAFPLHVVDASVRKYGGWDVQAEDGTGGRALIQVVTTRWLLRCAQGSGRYRYRPDHPHHSSTAST